MKYKYILILISLFFIDLHFCLASSSQLKNLDDQATIEEGVRWRKELTFTLKDEIEVKKDADSLHRTLVEIERGLCDELKDNETNFIAWGFTILGENLAGTLEWDTKSFFPYKENEKPLIFRSGHANKIIGSNFFDKIGSRYVVYPPYVTSQTQDNTSALENIKQKLRLLSSHIFSSDNSNETIQTSNNQKEDDQSSEFLFGFDIIEEKTSTFQQRIQELEHDVDCLINISKQNIEKQCFAEEIKQQLTNLYGNSSTHSKISSEVIKLAQDELTDLDKNIPNEFPSKYLHSEQSALHYLRKNQEKILSEISSLKYGSGLPVTSIDSTGQNLPKLKNIQAIILHIHSSRDICRRCALTITKELESNNSFIDFFKKNLTHDQEPPLFSIFFSSRKEMPDKYRRSKHGYDNRFNCSINLKELDEKKYFVQYFFPYAASPDLLADL